MQQLQVHVIIDITDTYKNLLTFWGLSQQIVN